MLCFNLSLGFGSENPFVLREIFQMEVGLLDRQVQYQQLPHGGRLPQGKGLFCSHCPLKQNQVPAFSDKCHLCLSGFVNASEGICAHDTYRLCLLPSFHLEKEIKANKAFTISNGSIKIMLERGLEGKDKRNSQGRQPQLKSLWCSSSFRCGMATISVSVSSNSDSRECSLLSLCCVGNGRSVSSGVRGV